MPCDKLFVLKFRPRVIDAMSDTEARELLANNEVIRARCK